MENWDKRFLRIASEISNWSKDPTTKVGSVIVDSNTKQFISLGYNGLPRNIDDSNERLLNRETKLSIVIHAETNAILFSKVPLTGHCIYVTRPPCAQCAAKIIQSGLSRVVYVSPDSAFQERWSAEIKLSLEILKEANVQVIEYKLE